MWVGGGGGLEPADADPAVAAAAQSEERLVVARFVDGLREGHEERAHLRAAGRQDGSGKR